MPVFIKIARQDGNQSGVTSKGSVIERKGTTVILEWGAIKFYKRKFYWAGPNLPQSKILRFKNVKDAEEYKRKRILRRGNKDYSKLQPGRRIYKNGKLN